MVKEGVTGSSHVSVELEDRYDTVEPGTSPTFDGPAREGVTNIPISAEGVTGSKADSMIRKGFEGDGEEVSEAPDVGFELLDSYPSQDNEGELISKEDVKSANDEKDKKVFESNEEVESMSNGEGSKMDSMVAGV